MVSISHPRYEVTVPGNRSFHFGGHAPRRQPAVPSAERVTIGSDGRRFAKNAERPLGSLSVSALPVDHAPSVSAGVVAVDIASWGQVDVGVENESRAATYGECRPPACMSARRSYIVNSGYCSTATGTEYDWMRAMEEQTNRNLGLKRMIKQCRSSFQQRENLNYYDADDYQSAERKFVKYCLLVETGHAP